MALDSWKAMTESGFEYAFRPLAVCLWLAVLGIVGLIGPNAQAQDCALHVEVKDGEPASYQARGDRCEGTYDQLVANRINLRFAGFHQGAPDFDPQKDEAVQIKVGSFDRGREVLLRVTSTRSQYYYQMDTSAIAENGSFVWPLDVVRKLDEPLQPFDTAALACLTDCESDSSTRATLLPVSFSDPVENGGTLTVLAVADVELTSLTATLRQGDDVVFEDLALGGRDLPPHKPIRIPINGVEAGVAVLSLSALTSGNQRAYLEAFLRIPERGN